MQYFRRFIDDEEMSRNEHKSNEMQMKFAEMTIFLSIYSPYTQLKNSQIPFKTNFPFITSCSSPLGNNNMLERWPLLYVLHEKFWAVAGLLWLEKMHKEIIYYQDMNLLIFCMNKCKRILKPNVLYSRTTFIDLSSLFGYHNEIWLSF